MLKSILVGLDGSPSAATAVELGIQWAKKFNALLVGLGIVDEATIRRPPKPNRSATAIQLERDEELLKEARRAEAGLGTICGAMRRSGYILQPASRLGNALRGNPARIAALRSGLVRP